MPSQDHDEITPIALQAAGQLLEALSDTRWLDTADRQRDQIDRIGDYLIDRQLGEGGGGVVYHAVRPDWNDEFAIKVMHRPIGDGPAAQRVWRELTLVQDLDLPDVPRIFDYGIHDARLYIVAEHIDGLPLDDHCAHHRLDRHERARLLAQICDAVHRLHQHGIIHRDIKPANILIRPDGTPVIIDLGIATLLDDTVETLTAEGAPVGSVAYMAPEQARGERARISAQSDVYSLGATACRILAGVTPHEPSGPLYQALRRVAEEPVRDVRQLDPTMPNALAAVIQRAVRPDPDERFPSARALGEDLRRWASGRPVQSQPWSWRRAVMSSVRRHPGRWSWGAASTAVVATLAVLLGLSTANASIDREVRSRVDATVADAMRQFQDRFASEDYSKALEIMQLIEDFAVTGTLDEIGRDVDLDAMRHDMAMDMLRVIFTEDRQSPDHATLAARTLRAVFDDPPEDWWTPEQSDAFEQVFAVLPDVDEG